ncbi:hypothetical protein K501DRAFT_286323 [Backusella circina FSU 941]|nr:hypothetical protein K501DRAFT_286323 [Backusella circina FSU 941]
MAQPHQVYPQQEQTFKTEGYYYTQNEMDSLKYDQINYPVYNNYSPERHRSYAQESSYTPERHSSNTQEMNNNTMTLDHQTQSSASPNLYERERKLSKTLIEEAPPVQPPHTYDE